LRGVEYGDIGLYQLRGPGHSLKVHRAKTSELTVLGVDLDQRRLEGTTTSHSGGKFTNAGEKLGEESEP